MIYKSFLLFKSDDNILYFVIIDIYKSPLSYLSMAWTKDVNTKPDEKTSRINAAGIINISLENLWRDCYLAMSRGDLVLWNRKLDAIWIILGGDCKKDGDEDKECTKLNLKIYNTGKLNHKSIGFEKAKEDESILAAQQYLLLKEKSLFLRRLQNSQGKGTAYETGDDYDFD